MAKGSLLGKADSTLAAMSYKESMAGVPPDLKNVYDRQLENIKDIQTNVQTFFDNMHADHSALKDELKEVTSKALENLSMGPDPDDAGIELYNNYLVDVKQRLKKIPKGKKGDLARAKIRAEVSRLEASTNKMDETQLTLGKMIDNDQFDANATGANNMIMLTAIAKGEAERNIVNGNLVYSVKNPAKPGENITLTQADLKEMLVQTNPNFDSSFNKIHQGYNAVGKQKGTTWTKERTGAINNYINSLTDKKDYARTIGKPQGNMEYSLIDSLIGKDGNTTIFNTLNGMSDAVKSKYDADGSGKVDAADFTTAENAIELVKSLTDINSDNFDFPTAKRVAAEFYADGNAKKEFQDGVNMRPKEAGTSTDNEQRFGIDKWLFDNEKSGGKIQFGPQEGNAKPWITQSRIRGVYNAMIDGKLKFYNVFYEYDTPREMWTAMDLNKENNPEQETVDVGNQETFARNILDQRDDIWTDADIKAEEIDIETGKPPKKEKEKIKFSKKEFDPQSNLTIDTIDDADETVMETLNNQLPTGPSNPKAYSFSEMGSWKDKLFLTDLNGNKIKWTDFRKDNNLNIRSTEGEYVSFRTRSKDRVDQRKNLEILLYILKGTKYETEDGTATTLYEQFTPLKDWRKETEEGNAGADDL
tara:strand:+ start:12149 stop:14083 length:1935 start_codon:yes stop_codon:yes gene_type:complete